MMTTNGGPAPFAVDNRRPPMHAGLLGGFALTERAAYVETAADASGPGTRRQQILTALRHDGCVTSFRKPRTPNDARPQWTPIPAWTWMLIAIAAVVLTAFTVTTWLLTIASHAAAGTDLASARLDAVRTGLAAGGGAGAAVGLMLAFRRQHHQEIATLLTEQDATQRRITDLYTKAVEQLGSDKAPVRLGGLYALERLAQDSPSQRQTIVSVICAYLRMPFPTTDSTAPPAPHGNAVGASAETKVVFGSADNTWQQEKQVRLTAQRILSDHLLHADASQGSAGTAPPRFWPDIRIDLTGATLIDFNFAKCTVGEALFVGATFNGLAQFDQASFTGFTRFDRATFRILHQREPRIHALP